MFGKFKGKLNIRFKFNNAISEERGDEILFRVFDILLSPQKGQNKLKKKNNENNRSPNNPDKT